MRRAFQTAVLAGTAVLVVASVFVPWALKEAKRAREILQ
jgi:hypothetical protein